MFEVIEGTESEGKEDEEPWFRQHKKELEGETEVRGLD